jgi:hypothetical protein
MVWPVAALAAGLLGFVVVYGTIVQSRLERLVTDALDSAEGPEGEAYAGGPSRSTA